MPKVNYFHLVRNIVTEKSIVIATLPIKNNNVKTDEDP